MNVETREPGQSEVGGGVGPGAEQIIGGRWAFWVRGTVPPYEEYPGVAGVLAGVPAGVLAGCWQGC